MDDLPFASEIAPARTIVTPLNDLLPRGGVDVTPMSFQLSNKGKKPASLVVANPFVSHREDGPSSSAHLIQVATDTSLVTVLGLKRPFYGFN